MLEPEWTESLRDELKWLGTRLGVVRDLDVLRDRLAEAAGDDRGALDPLFEALGAAHTRARADLLDALNSLRFGDLQGRLLAAARRPNLREAAAREPAATALPGLVAAAWEHLAKAGRGLDPSADAPETLHEVRIRAKRARYAAEAVAPALDPAPSKDAAAFAAAAADVQDLLGEFHDAVVAAERVRQIARSRPDDAAFQEAARAWPSARTSSPTPPARSSPTSGASSTARSAGGGSSPERVQKTVL